MGERSGKLMAMMEMMKVMMRMAAMARTTMTTMNVKRSRKFTIRNRKMGVGVGLRQLKRLR